MNSQHEFEMPIQDLAAEIADAKKDHFQTDEVTDNDLSKAMIMKDDGNYCTESGHPRNPHQVPQH